MLNAGEIKALLAGKEADIIASVAETYKLHSQGKSNVPQSTFLRFPEQPRNRVIALPSFLGGDDPLAGMKWIASFPANIEHGLQRASAIMVLNSPNTGRPEAFLEASQISAKRTAASAALAARILSAGTNMSCFGIVGCGVINFEVLRFVHSQMGTPDKLLVFDTNKNAAESFLSKCRSICEPSKVEVVSSIDHIASDADLVSFATTSLSPHIGTETRFESGATLLHVSLRDLKPEMILEADNIVDDVDHVCRAETSVHIAEQLSGNREFIRCTLGEILLGDAQARSDKREISIFSPFGLGILDLAVGRLASKLAIQQGVGTHMKDFLPE